MTIELLSELLRDLLKENNRVFLPGMGSFFADVMPAVITNNGNTINPPYKKVYFRSNEIWNDGLLETSYAEKSSLGVEVAREKIEAFVKDFIRELNTKKSIEFPGLGIMRATTEKNYFFVAEDDLDIYNDAFGLEPISLKKILYSDRVSESGSAEKKSSYESGKERERSFLRDSLSSSSDRVSSDHHARRHIRWMEKRKKTRKRWIIIASIVALLLLLIGLFFLLVYLESPILDRLLYSDEELRLLRGV